MNEKPAETILEFGALLQREVAIFKHELVLAEDRTDAPQPLATYEVAGELGKTTLVVHQTRRSIESEHPEYRVRGSTDLDPRYCDWFKGRESWANQYASLGCFITREHGAEVSWQTVLDPLYTRETAFLAATACVHAAPAFAFTTRASLGFNEETAKPDRSEWTQLDFEQLHYDYAHIGVGQLEPGKLSFFTPKGQVDFVACHDDPYYGGGLRGLVQIRKDQLGLETRRPFTANELNAVDLWLGDAPMYGGWYEDEDRFYFGSMIPNIVRRFVPEISDHVFDWAVRRIRDVYEMVHVWTMEGGNTHLA